MLLTYSGTSEADEPTKSWCITAGCGLTCETSCSETKILLQCCWERFCRTHRKCHPYAGPAPAPVRGLLYCEGWPWKPHSGPCRSCCPATGTLTYCSTVESLKALRRRVMSPCSALPSSQLLQRTSAASAPSMLSTRQQSHSLKGGKAGKPE